MGNKHIKSGKTGTNAELAVAARMSSLGFSVSIPVGDERYDLVAERDGRCIRVQVKTASFNKGGSYRTCLRHGRIEKKNYSPEECDAVVLYAPYSEDFEGIHEDGFYIIPTEVLFKEGKFHATLFPAGMGRGNLRTCKWEKYRDAWETI